MAAGEICLRGIVVTYPKGSIHERLMLRSFGFSLRMAITDILKMYSDCYLFLVRHLSNEKSSSSAIYVLLYLIVSILDPSMRQGRWSDTLEKGYAPALYMMVTLRIECFFAIKPRKIWSILQSTISTSLNASISAILQPVMRHSLYSHRMNLIVLALQ